MLFELPMSQISPPFGDVTLIEDVWIVKFASETSVTMPFVTLVITTV